MKFSTRMIATAAFAFSLLFTFSLSAEEAAKASAGDDKTADSATQLAAPLPEAPMAATQTYSSRPKSSAPRVELFMGYSYLRAMPTLDDNNRLLWLNGGSTSLAVNFNRHLGLVADFGGFNDSQFRLIGNPSKDVDASGTVFTYLLGPRLSFRSHERITPFVQALFGGIHASEVTLSSGSSGCSGAGCTPLPAENTFAMTAGGGLDLKVRNHLAIRLIQAEYLMTNFDDRNTGKSAFQNDMRLSSGLVFRFGGNPAPLLPVTLSCSANPASVFSGDPVTVTATAGNLDPKLHVIYSITGAGLRSNEATATVATATLVPGPYTVNCDVKEGQPGKEGLKPWRAATATATFRVKAFEPPTLGCSASPSTIKPGETATVTASGMSPQNRPLIYSYSATSGTISGTGTTAEFNSAGAATGSTAITCNVTDDKGQTATANASLMIAAPPLEPSPEQVRLEARLALHSIFFPTAQPRVEKPNGGLLASQEGTLTTLATDFKRYLELKPDAHLTLSGHADVRGTVEYNQALSERRVARTKQFLVQQGVPEANIETRGLGKDQELTTDQVKELVEQNPDLSTPERTRILHDLSVIVLAQNRRVDVTLSTTGQQSVRLYPFNAADSLTLLDKKSSGGSSKKATTRKKK